MNLKLFLVQEKYDKKRLLLGLNNTQVAEKAGVTNQYLSKIANGKRNCSPGLAKKIQEVLKVESLDEITIIKKV